jgi:hypothetical protein
VTVDRARIRGEILRLTGDRGEGKSVCPSEVARALAGNWRPLMGPVREEAARLAGEGRIAVLQRGEPVDPSSARGPVRLARAPRRP